MKYGICGDPALAALAASAGFDFFEWSVGALLKPREPREAFLQALAVARAAALSAPVLNCFLPGDLKVTGPQADPAAQRAFVETACERAAEAGVTAIVFGSGGARAIPEGFDRAAAWRQLVDFGALLAPLAQRHGVTIAVEPLNRQECNVLTTVGECAALVREVNHPGLRLLVDAYHFLRDGDSLEALAAHGSLLAHVHVATVPKRLVPGAEPCDFGPFFEVLKRVGYTGRVSIEARLDDAARELPAALALLRRLGG